MWFICSLNSLSCIIPVALFETIASRRHGLVWAANWETYNFLSLTWQIAAVFPAQFSIPNGPDVLVQKYPFVGSCRQAAKFNLAGRDRTAEAT